MKETINEAQNVAGLNTKSIETEESRRPDIPIESVEASKPDAVTSKNTEQVDSSHINSFRSEIAPYRQGRFSPPLGQSLWLDSDRLARVFDVPADAAPYLGDGISTLAACFYWASVNHTVSLWKEFNQPGASVRTDRNRLDRLYNHSKHLTDGEFLMALAQARLGHKQKQLAGQTESWWPHTKEESIKTSMLSPLYLKVKKEYEERGERLDWWKNPQEVEDYMRKHMSEKDCADLQAVVEGRGSRAAAIKFAPLVEALAESYVCFGDSPRWNAIHVSMTLGIWLRNTTLQNMIV